MSKQCPNSEIQELIALVQESGASALPTLASAIEGHPQDPRLRFLNGSVQATAGRYVEALADLREAVRLAPRFTVARFQLGLLELTCGNPAMAEVIWQPLLQLPHGNPFPLMVMGLTALAARDWTAANKLIQAGICLNLEVPQINQELISLLAKPPLPPGELSGEDLEPKHFLLAEYLLGNTTKH